MIIFVIISSLIRSPIATCPTGWFVNGVRPDGSSSCIYDDPREVNCRGARSCNDTLELIEIPVQIHCRPGEEPRVIDGRTIKCV